MRDIISNFEVTKSQSPLKWTHFLTIITTPIDVTRIVRVKGMQNLTFENDKKWHKVTTFGGKKKLLMSALHKVPVDIYKKRQNSLDNISKIIEEAILWVNYVEVNISPSSFEKIDVVRFGLTILKSQTCQILVIIKSIVDRFFCTWICFSRN